MVGVVICIIILDDGGFLSRDEETSTDMSGRWANIFVAREDGAIDDGRVSSYSVRKASKMKLDIGCVNRSNSDSITVHPFF